MADFSFSSAQIYDFATNNGSYNDEAAYGTQSGTLTNNLAGTTFSVGESIYLSTDLVNPIGTFAGSFLTQDNLGNPITLFMIDNGAGGTNNKFLTFSPNIAAETVYVASFTTSDPEFSAAAAEECFAPGTLIATPRGEVAVETLTIGDDILTADGRTVAVKWMGIVTRDTRFGVAEKMRPVRISKDALGAGLPHSDLTVTADHAIRLHGLMVNAGVMVNDTTITFVPHAELPTQKVFYHVETEQHDVILANGLPAETFIDYRGRKNFDNYAEYLSLYGLERIMPELPLPRISSQRMLPAILRAQLGLEEDLDLNVA